MTTYSQTFNTHYETCKSTLHNALHDVYENLYSSRSPAFKAALGASVVVLGLALVGPHVAALVASLGVTAKLLAAAGFVQQAFATLIALAQTTLGWAASLLPHSSHLAGHPVLTQFVGATVTTLGLGVLGTLGLGLLKSLRDLVDSTEFGHRLLPVRFHAVHTPVVHKTPAPEVVAAHAAAREAKAAAAATRDAANDVTRASMHDERAHELADKAVRLGAGR